MHQDGVLIPILFLNLHCRQYFIPTHPKKTHANLKTGSIVCKLHWNLQSSSFHISGVIITTLTHVFCFCKAPNIAKQNNLQPLESFRVNWCYIMQPMGNGMEVLLSNNNKNTATVQKSYSDLCGIKAYCNILSYSRHIVTPCSKCTVH